MADTLVERLNSAAQLVLQDEQLNMIGHVVLQDELHELLTEAAARIGLLTRSLEVLCKQTSNTSAQGDGSGE
jgi:hypothetical protein